MKGKTHFLRSWRELRRFQRLPAAERRIVIYSEGAPYGWFFQPVVESLVGDFGRTLAYVTSDADDPVLAVTETRIRPFYVGHESARIFLFEMLDAAVMVMTMPDLETFHIKRSRRPVRYVHLLHSMVSTHMIYRKGAFDHFDAVLCTGPHQMREIREWERIKGLAAKDLFEHGYGPLDVLIERARAHPGPGPAAAGRLKVLVAPSWGPQGLLETRGAELVGILLDGGHKVHVRPHPRTRQLASTRLDALAQRFRAHPRFSIDEDTTDPAPLLDSHALVSDWSGVALEYAFALERPVLFIDVPRKINNPEYALIPWEPLEAAIRTEIGAVLAPARMNEAPAALAALVGDGARFASRARAQRDRWVFNVGTSGRRGAEIVEEILGRREAPDAR